MDNSYMGPVMPMPSLGTKSEISDVDYKITDEM